MSCRYNLAIIAVRMAKVRFRCCSLLKFMARRKVRQHKRLIQLVEGITALIAVSNLALVLFDLSYISLRPLWQQAKIPLYYTEISLKPIVTWYDPYKGIEPNPNVQAYLDRLDRLDLQIRNTGLQSPQTAQIVADLQRLSLQILEEDPFQLTGQVDTLEKIQNLLRGRLGADSSKEAFRQFWTIAYLSQTSTPQTSTQPFAQTLPEEIDRPLVWFNDRVRPLMERSNYIRKIGITGEFINDFWRIDRWFVLYCFIPELLIRILLIRWQHPSLNLLDAALWRWYDFVLILPVLRWLRLIPVVIRLQGAGLVDFEPIRAQASRGFVAAIAGELIEVIALQVINQLQRSIQRGEVTQWLLQSSQQEYIDLNNINEIQEISRQLARMTVFEVLPNVQTDVANLLSRNVEITLRNLPLYQALNSFPGFQTLPEQLARQASLQLSDLMTQWSQNTYNTLSIEDPVITELIDRLADNIRQSFADALLEQSTQAELQSLISAFLEEVKVNYVRRLNEEDFDNLLEEAKQLTQRL